RTKRKQSRSIKNQTLDLERLFLDCDACPKFHLTHKLLNITFSCPCHSRKMMMMPGLMEQIFLRDCHTPRTSIFCCLLSTRRDSWMLKLMNRKPDTVENSMLPTHDVTINLTKHLM